MTDTLLLHPLHSTEAKEDEPFDVRREPKPLVYSGVTNGRSFEKLIQPGVFHSNERECVCEPVIAPEQLFTNSEARRTENSDLLCALCLLA